MIETKLVDSMGSDLSVVNAARVSFDKASDWEYEYVEDVDIDSRTIITAKVPKKLKAGDEKLIAFLARENHWTPFGHASISVHVKAPIFVARQLGKHQVGLVWNEVSRRYVDSPPEFYYPENWRARNKDKKQGSHEDQFVENIEIENLICRDFNGNLFPSENITTQNLVERTVNGCIDTYQLLLNAGVCPEQARMVLPQNMMTEWYWSGSLIAFARVCNLRLKKDTQKETRFVAEQIDEIASKLFPVSWKHLKKV
jgi:thymidylate synthase (FAD)